MYGKMYHTSSAPPLQTTTKETTMCEHTAWDQDETDACQKGTPGCSVNHDAADAHGHGETSCETW